MLFSVHTMEDRYAREILITLALKEGLRNAGLALAYPELLYMDIKKKSDPAKLRNKLRALYFYKKVLSVNPHRLEFVITTAEQPIEAGVAEKMTRIQVATFLCDHIFSKWGDSPIWHPDADIGTGKTWERLKITEHMTLADCKNTLRGLLKKKKTSKIRQAVEVCLSAHFPRGSSLFQGAIEKIREQELAAERLLKLLALRIVRERKT